MYAGHRDAILQSVRPQLEALHAEAFAWSLSCTRGDASEAEDVLQEAYILVLQGNAYWRRQSSLKTWLYGVIRNVARKRRRQRAWREVLLFQWWSEPAPESPAPQSEQAAPDPRLVWLRKAMEQLPKRQREVLDLVSRHGMTVDGAAEVLGIGAGSARTHYHRAKQQLAARWQEEEKSWQTSTAK